MTVERAIPDSPQWPQLAAPHLSRYQWASEFVAGRRVLDVGTGAGYGAAILHAAGAAAVQGIDIDPEAVADARRRCAAKTLAYSVDDGEVLRSVGGGWEVVTCFEVIEHLHRPEAFLARAGELLAADGVLLVSTPDRAASPPFVAGRPRNPFHEHEWYRDEFAALLGRHFHDVDVRVQVESMGSCRRAAAVRALREGLMVSNPLAVFVWRKWPLRRKADRAWAALEGLAAPGVVDFPIVPPAIASLYGAPRFTVGICRRPFSARGTST
ncbi:MAG: class I SAM-dependent methyltransferase [Pirellulales bacterium]